MSYCCQIVPRTRPTQPGHPHCPESWTCPSARALLLLSLRRTGKASPIFDLKRQTIDQHCPAVRVAFHLPSRTLAICWGLFDIYRFGRPRTARIKVGEPLEALGTRTACGQSTFTGASAEIIVTMSCCWWISPATPSLGIQHQSHIRPSGTSHHDSGFIFANPQAQQDSAIFLTSHWCFEGFQR